MCRKFCTKRLSFSPDRVGFAALSWVLVMSASNLSVKIQRLVPEAQVPQYAHPGDAGADLVAVVDCVIPAGQWLAVPTGLSAEIPIGFELQVRPRSGLAFKKGVTVLNAPGTIDAGYRGEIKVILINHGPEPFEIKAGDKIAQLVVASVVTGLFEEVQELEDSQRGSGGFGSTGV
jgi:dUTP pyrophosphatase